MPPKRLSYGQRVPHFQNEAARKFLELMERKKSNLSVAADVLSKAELIKIADNLGPYICLLKTHIDIVEDFDQDLTQELLRLSKLHDFMIFEDRKFADIGNTVKYQYGNGIYHISDWADFVNAHTVPGPGIIAGLREVGLKKGRGLMLLAEMSPKGALATGEYTRATIEMAKSNTDFVMGFVSGRRLVESDEHDFIYMTPGVSMSSAGDNLGQQYNTPDKVIRENLSDVIIVGRGIYEAPDSVGAAKEYQKAGWEAYLESLE